jgi:hypothetical protein
MSSRADIIAVDATGGSILVVEAKDRLRVSTDWAAKLRRNLITHGIVGKAKYFLLATPDRFFLWKNGSDISSEVPPTIESDASELLAPYFAAAGITPETVSGHSFELIVGAWLRDLLASDALPNDVHQKYPWLAGLLDDLKGGHVAYEAVA